MCLLLCGCLASISLTATLVGITSPCPGSEMGATHRMRHICWLLGTEKSEGVGVSPSPLCPQVKVHLLRVDEEAALVDLASTSILENE